MSGEHVPRRKEEKIPELLIGRWILLRRVASIPRLDVEVSCAVGDVPVDVVKATDPPRARRLTISMIESRYGSLRDYGADRGERIAE